MVLPLIIGGLEAAAEAAPLVGRFAMQALPYIGAAWGAAPELKRGNIPGAAVQALLGGITGSALKGGLSMAGAKLAPFAGSSITAAEAAQGIPVLGKLIPEGASLAEKARIGSQITQAAKLGAAAAPIGVAGVLAQQALAAPPAAGGYGGGGGGQGGAGVPGGGPINTALGYGGLAQNYQQAEQYNKQGLKTWTPDSGAVPQITQLPSAAQLFNPVGPYQGGRQFGLQLQRDQQGLMAQEGNWVLQNSDTEQQRQMQRSAALANLKTQLGTQQSLILNAQQQGAALAQQGLADVGAIARTNFYPVGL